MAKPDNKVTCGKITITYPGDCSYVCYCTPESGCHWSVTCGDWTTGGKGLIAERPTQPHATVAGKLEACAKILEQRWKRPVIVPTKLRSTDPTDVWTPPLLPNESGDDPSTLPPGP